MMSHRERLWLCAFLVFLTVLATLPYMASLRSQPASPSAINGCIIVSASFSITNFSTSDRASIPFTCDSQGRLRTTTTP